MRKRIFRVALFIMMLMGFYSFYLEPQWLDVTHHAIRGKLAYPLKIAHLTDLHFGNYFRLAQRVLSEIEHEKPDIIFITGDLYENPSQTEELRNFLKSLKAPLGVYAVNGNWENWTPMLDAKMFWENLGISLLVNETRSPREDLEILGYDDKGSGRPSRNLASGTKTKFQTCLFHSPAFFDEVFTSCSLALSGHTHGGQIKMPLWGPLWLPEGSGSYVEGWYQKEDSRMYLSRGLGTSLVPLRFLARPELAFISVYP